MQGKTHTRIAKQIAKVLELEKSNANLLTVGSTRPDSWDRDFPHHTGKDLKIVQNLFDAKELYVKNDDECYAKLGVALHYIQDKWTLRPRVEDKHTKYEMDMQSSPLLNDSQLVEFIKNCTMPTKAKAGYSRFMKEISLAKMPSWFERKKYILLRGEGARVLNLALQTRPSIEWSYPTIDLNLAYRISLEVTRGVISHRDTGMWESEIVSDHMRCPSCGSIITAPKMFCLCPVCKKKVSMLYAFLE